ncbi:unnamed protein product [Cochlearia groenlandica]
MEGPPCRFFGENEEGEYFQILVNILTRLVRHVRACSSPLGVLVKSPTSSCLSSLVDLQNLTHMDAALECSFKIPLVE